MRHALSSLLQRYPEPYLTDMEMEVLLDESSPDSRYSKVKRLIAQGTLVHIRRGLYGITERIGTPVKAHPYALAQAIYGPSYVSLESALSYHQLIPEAVYTVTSATIKRAKEFTTPMGVFSYAHFPTKYFLVEVERVVENDATFFMARPWKAIGDYVFHYRKPWTGVSPLEESLRIDLDTLPELTEDAVQSLMQYYKKEQMVSFFKGVQEDMVLLRGVK